ncbi:Nucleoside triphosphate pyrophosphohydrolase OS=Streptomyces tendae OX=1932 GN=GUR47_27800 PE=3 SV=1 [Streptomyces tendae]
MDACAGGRTAVVVATGEGEPALTDSLARLAGSGRVSMPELELLPASYDLPGARLLDLVQVMDRIRLECPWSSRRTHEGLAKYAIEEAYELVEAIEDGDRDELHGRRAAPGRLPRPYRGGGPRRPVLRGRRGRHHRRQARPPSPARLQRVECRHPRGGPGALAAHQGRRGSSAPRSPRASPYGQPGLALAAKLHSRVRTTSLDVPLPSGEGVGYQLLALAARAESEGTDPEAALRAAARTYRDAIRAVEG